MIVIEDVLTQKRYTYPSTNANIETHAGFVQVNYVPYGFILSGSQDTSGLEAFTQDWPARPHDPLNQTRERDRI